MSKSYFAMDYGPAMGVAIALLNSQDSFSDPARAAQWWSAIRERAQALPIAGSLKPRFGAELLAELRSLRDASVSILDGYRASEHRSSPPLDAVNRALAGAQLSLMAAQGGPPIFLHSVESGDGTVLAPLAFAVGLLLQSDLRRLKRCVRPECRRYFLDATKNGSRRWCDLSCMERVRAPRRRLPR